MNMAHQPPSGGLPSGHPSDGVNANKRPVSASSEKENPPPTHRPIQQTALLFSTAPLSGPAAPAAPPPPPVGASQNNTQPSPVTGAQPWLSESAQTQARTSAAAAEAASSPVETGEDTDIGASDGTTGETEALTAALSDFSLHADKAANRTASISDIEKKRINDAMSHTLS